MTTPPILKNRQLIVALRLLLGVVFIYASLDKIANPQQFAIAVRGYQLMPLQFSNLFAIALPWSELIVGIFLILGIFTRQAAAAVFLLLGMFIVAVSTVLIRGMVIDCGCFSSEGGSHTGPMLIIRNTFLLVSALLVMRYDTGFLSLRPTLRKTSPEAS